MKQWTVWTDFSNQEMTLNYRFGEVPTSDEVVKALKKLRKRAKKQIKLERTLNAK